MSSLYLSRQSSEQRLALISDLHASQGGSCFICAKPVDLLLHSSEVDIDHVEPISVGGKDAPENFALTHAACNRSKQASDLRVARLLASFDTIADEVKSDNRSPNLADILGKYGGAKHDLTISIAGSILKTSFSEIGEVDILETPIHADGLSGFRYVFLNMPIEYLKHDDRINPRAIGKNLRKLIEEFHKRFPQLHIALGWIDTSSGDKVTVKIFDGQHKAAAQILLGAKRLPVRIFIDPNTDVLLTANTNAGTFLRQVAFDKSAQRSLGSTLLLERINRYRADLDLEPDDESFSEVDLVSHFKAEKSAMKKNVIDAVRHQITFHQDNNLRSYIEYGGRGTEMPFSYSTIEKTFYSFFIHGGLLDTPFSHKVEEGANPRQLEVEQIVRLMNIIAHKIYIDKFDHSRGTRRIEHDIQNKVDVPEPHLRAFRMAKEESLYNWLRYVRQIVSQFFITTGRPIDENKLFQYIIPDQCWDNIENFIDSLMRLTLWVNKGLASSVFGGKQAYGYWQSIFEDGSTPSGQRVMSSGLNLMEMIKPKDGV